MQRPHPRRAIHIWPLAALMLAAMVVLVGATRASAQTPEPTVTGVPDPGLRLSLTQKADAPGAQAVVLSIAAAYPVQVRLFENRSLLLFDGFTSDAGGSFTRIYTRECGRRYSYDLYAVVDGAVAATRSATITLCPDGVPPSPVPSPAPAPPISPTRAPAPAPAAAVPLPSPMAAAAPSRSTRQPGEPSVPAPPLEPPSAALSSGFALAQPDDMAATSATISGVPFLRLLAIWLRGSDTDGQGGDYQYVLVANLGGADQDLSGWALQGDSGPISGLTFYFPDGFSLSAGSSCRIYVGHPAENTCTDGSFALYHFWGDHGTASLWDNQGAEIDALPY